MRGLPWNRNGDGNEEDETHDGPRVFGSRTMSTTWLLGRHDPGRTVMKDDLGIPPRDFVMDPSQDLMVLFKERTLHRTSISFVFWGGGGR